MRKKLNDSAKIGCIAYSPVERFTAAVNVAGTICSDLAAKGEFEGVDHQTTCSSVIEAFQTELNKLIKNNMEDLK